MSKYALPYSGEQIKDLLGFVDGATSNIQEQLNLKAESSHTHDVSDITSGTLSIENGGTGATDAETARANLGVAAENHVHSYKDIESVAAIMLANQGNAPLVHIIPMYNEDATVTPSDYNIIAYSPATGMIHVNMTFTKTETVAAGTPLFYLPFEAFGGNSYTSSALTTVYETDEAVTYAQTIPLATTVKALTESVNGCGVCVTLGTKIGAGRRIVIEGVLPTHSLLLRHDPVALEKMREAVCRAMRDMEGLYDYNNDNAGRLTPETSGYTDCSGATYTAYKRALGWHIGGVEDYQAVRGRHIARFVKGEEIPLWLLQKADLILLYKESSDTWSHAAMYMGDNVLWDMDSSTYPNGIKGQGTYLRTDNVSTGLEDAWGSGTWTHVDVVRFIV